MPENLVPLITEGLNALGVSFPPCAPEKLEKYCAILLEKNKVMNLTAIKEPSQVVALHFLDSAVILKAADLSGARVIDVGTGAGFPGLVLKILEPSLNVTLIDSQKKRVDFLNDCVKELSLCNVTCMHARAEEVAVVPGYREAFDLSVSRAVAQLNVLCELCIPFLKIGGEFIAMKSTDSDGEAKAAENVAKILGACFLPHFDYTIPATDVKHRLIRLLKRSETPKNYPRKYAKISKSPL